MLAASHYSVIKCFLLFFPRKKGGGGLGGQDFLSVFFLLHQLLLMNVNSMRNPLSTSSICITLVPF